MSKKFEKKVNWTFTMTLEGHGRNVREALLKSLENLENQIERDFHKNDFNSIELHNVVAIDEDGSQYGFEDDEEDGYCPRCAGPKASGENYCDVCNED